INWNNSDDLNDFNSIDEDNIYQFEEIPTSSQALNYSGSGELINITLHQSLLNTSVIEFPNLDTSNSFSEPFPQFSGYNTSFINMTLNDIYAPNKTLIVEEGDTGSTLLALKYWTSFTIVGDCYLENISVKVHTSGSGDTFNIDVYNATQSGSDIKYGTDLNGAPVLKSIVVNNGNPHWENITNLHTRLYADQSYQKTFFVSMSIAGFDGYWHQENEGNGDNSIVWRTGGSNPETGIDMTLKLGLSPLNNIPKPSEINLKVNSSTVTDISSGSGYFSSTQKLQSGSNHLDFTVNSDWWDVSCNITKVQINYTKSDVNALSNFQILGSGQTVQWNVTIPSGLNYFDSRISDFNTINFTIPDTWLESSIQVFNGGTNKTSDLVERLLGNGYREVQVLDAYNGTFWHLNATSSNLLTNIIASLGSIPQFSYNHSDTVNFTAQFISYISDGNLNLSVYTPTTELLNYTSIKDISLETPGVEFFIDNWQISSTLKVSEYGSYIVQMAWNNNSAAGFFEITVDIFADTELIWDIPKTTFDSNETFNIDVFFNDTGINRGIDADSFTYSIQGNPSRTDNITINGNGNYTISIASKDVEFSGFGHKQIEIFANELYHNNQSEIIDITLLGLTKMVDLSMIGGATYNSSDNIVVKVFYNDTVRNLGITLATVEYRIEGNPYHSFTDLGNGNYSITISAFDNEFGGYGSKNIDVRINKEFYYNQSKLMSIQILGETSITAQRLPNKAYYNSAETFNISIYYEDIAKSIGISGATIEIDVDTNPYSPIVYDNLDGWYNITIDCSDAIFSSYTNFGIRINVSNSYYYNQTDTLNTVIVGNVSLAVISPAMDLVYVEGDDFVI
ncbi:MAG: hypothetical protein ACTSR7_20425, partial [Promethearchaeota archaeon]